jgi:L-ascorbate metabolism protein UlaG (beta-lactamase superfamily)
MFCMDLQKDIKWFGRAAFEFTDTNGNKIYYADPFNLRPGKLEKADLIFITHAHPDHFSHPDIAKIIKDNTIIIAPPDVLSEIKVSDELKLPVEPNQNYEVKGFKFHTIPAYNTNPAKLQFHPKTNNWVGYIFELNGKSVYHAGDTDFIEEMKSLKHLNLDVAMLPIGGVYTMEVEEAAQAANAIAAKITVPMHYRELNPYNYQKLEEDFKKLVTDSEVQIFGELS